MHREDDPRSATCETGAREGPDVSASGSDAQQTDQTRESTPGTGVDGKSFAIGVLTLTACVLFVGFLFVSQRPAHAIGQSDKGGDYKMLTYRVSSTQELLFVFDSAAKKAIAYEFDTSRRRLEMVTGVPLDQLPKPPPEPIQTPPRGRNP